MAVAIDKSLGENLVAHSVITSDQLRQAMTECNRTGEPLRAVLTRLGMVSQTDMAQFLSELSGVPFVSLSDYLIDPQVLDLMPEETARRSRMLPLFKIGNTLTVAMADPTDVVALDEARLKSGCEVEPAITTEEDLNTALEHYYGVKGSIDEVVKSLDEEEIDLQQSPEEEAKVRLAAEEAPVVKLVNLILAQGAREKASDIHIEPAREKLRVRYRIDGILHEAEAPPKYLQAAVCSRIKILSGLDIAEQRVPQDGRFHMRLDDRTLDLRVSTFPTICGENVVIRLLDSTSVLMGLDQFGMAQADLEKLKKIIHQPHGVVLVTGPTGSGKTTTLYGALSDMNTPEKNIITIEDPVEYELDMVRQSEVNRKAGLTFATGLRSILRQDPDVIMVGEIRDQETGEIAVQAALTGHLVLSTLHTNDAPGAITRMMDMGVEPFLIASTVSAVLAQRLVRMICTKCEETYEAPDALLEELGISNKEETRQFARGKGCKHCRGSGYKGRTGIYELMKVDQAIKKLIIDRASGLSIGQAAVRAGMRTLRSDGIAKAMAGVTSLEEVLRVTKSE